MQDVTLAKRESLAASTPLGKVLLGKLPDGKRYRTKRCEVAIETGAAGLVTVDILVGDSKLLPEKGSFDSDLAPSVSRAQIDLPEGAQLFVQRKNDNATTAYVYNVVLDLEEIAA